MTEKRDGSNISLWIDDNNEVHISTHNLENADENFSKIMKETKEYKKIIELLQSGKQFNEDFICYGELIQKGLGATRIEGKHSSTKWVLFDIWGNNAQRYMPYNYIFQRAFHFKLPIVKAVNIICPKNLDDLKQSINETLLWCKKHKKGRHCRKRLL